jgi:hypothetical protein
MLVHKGNISVGREMSFTFDIEGVAGDKDKLQLIGVLPYVLLSWASGL